MCRAAAASQVVPVASTREAVVRTVARRSAASAANAAGRSRPDSGSSSLPSSRFSIPNRAKELTLRIAEVVRADRVEAPSRPRLSQTRLLASLHSRSVRLAGTSCSLTRRQRQREGVEPRHAVPADERWPEEETREALVKAGRRPLANVRRAAMGAPHAHRSGGARNGSIAAAKSVNVVHRSTASPTLQGQRQLDLWFRSSERAEPSASNRVQSSPACRGARD